MDITIDIGKHVIEKISAIAKEESKQFDIMLLELIDLGLRIYLSSKESDDNVISDPILSTILHKAAGSQFLLREILSHVFNKDHSYFKVYDADTAIKISQNMADSFMESLAHL